MNLVSASECPLFAESAATHRHCAGCQTCPGQDWGDEPGFLLQPFVRVLLCYGRSGVDPHPREVLVCTRCLAERPLPIGADDFDRAAAWLGQ